MTPLTGKFSDPLKMCRLLWPHIVWSKEQKDIIYSVRDNDETFVPAGNQLGKDFVSAFIALWFFLSRTPCRVVTTSVDHTQLHGVLWGEIRRFIQTAKYPLTSTSGGPILVNDLLLRKIYKGEVDGISYLIGRVAAKGEGMLGHHCFPNLNDFMYGMNLPHSLLLTDEASGVDDETFEKGDTWAKRKLIIGNPYQCTNYFYRGIKGVPGTKERGGDLPRPDGIGYYRKVIKIKAEQSPNVRLGLAQERMGIEPTHEILVPGLKTFADYKKHRNLWDDIKQCVCLDAEFYEGGKILMYPPDWLNHANKLADSLKGKTRKALTIGCDPAEGGDSSCWAVCDELGLIELISMKTPDTSIITGYTLALMKRYKVDATNVLFDRGGGGKEHADRLRLQGHNVRTIAFGESPTDLKKYDRATKQSKAHRVDVDETRYAYKNRRAEMYGILRLLLDYTNGDGYALPAEYIELRRQLAPIPLRYDAEGRLILPPKHIPDGSKNTKTETMADLIGCSPDEADALVLGTFGIVNKPSPFMATTR